MNARLKRAMRAFGSVLDVMPATDYSRYVPRGSDRARIEGDWAAVGAQLQGSIDKHGQAVAREKRKRKQERAISAS